MWYQSCKTPGALLHPRLIHFTDQLKSVINKPIKKFSDCVDVQDPAAFALQWSS